MITQTLKVKDPLMMEKFFIDVLGFEKNFEANTIEKDSFGLRFVENRTQGAEISLRFPVRLEEMKNKIEFFLYRTAFKLKIKTFEEPLKKGVSITYGRSFNLEIQTD